MLQKHYKYAEKACIDLISCIVQVVSEHV